MNRRGKDSQRVFERDLRGGECTSGHGEIYEGLKNIVAKLCVLRDSCAGKMHTDKYSENVTWFQGAETMLQRAVDELQKALGCLEEVMISIAEREKKDSDSHLVPLGFSSLLF